MKDHINFYENIAEARMRIRNTVVLYDGIPYYVLAVTNHKPDGIFRVYLSPLSIDDDSIENPGILSTVPSDSPAVGTILDQYIDEKPNTKILRKMMNSPKFNRFRPFPLGMCNFDGSVHYIERQPQRNREQGLTASMLYETTISLGGKRVNSRSGGMMQVPLTKGHFRSCILGEYPAVGECVDKLRDPKIDNEAVAFHRDFAIVRGPVRSLFLAYKEDVVGHLVEGNLSRIEIDEDFIHVKEAVEELGVFNSIAMKG